MVFCSPDGLKCLSDYLNWYGDSTLYSASKYYYQLYVIQAWKDGLMIPCAWILINRRRKKDYEKVCKASLKEARKHGLSLNPKHCMFDFELAVIKAFKTIFPDCIPKGCTFHLGQSMMRHIGSL